jgi:hypothetical protein
MPVQSKRISLSALGIDGVPGMENGFHLRIGFDPRMGFPPCGFLLYGRDHHVDETLNLDFDLLFEQQISAPFRHGYLQNGVAVFHPKAPNPERGGSGGVDIRNQILGISFRTSPFIPDSDPKVCEVRLSFKAEEGEITVKAFDDRYNNNGFNKILVAHQKESFDSPNPFHLRADLISLVEIEAPEGTQLIGFEYTLIEEHRAWTRLPLPDEGIWGGPPEMPLLLPLPDPESGSGSGYLTCKELEFQQQADVIEQELPIIRLKTGFVPRQDQDDVHGEYDNVDDYLAVYLGPDFKRFEELREPIKALQSVPPEHQIDLTIDNPGEDADDSSTISPLLMILSGAVDYHFARLIGLAAIDMNPMPPGANSMDFMVEAQWEPEVSHFWITHDVFPGRDGVLNDPVAPDGDPVLDVTRTGFVKTNVRLKWVIPDRVARLDRANQYAGYLLYRRKGDGEQSRLTEAKDELTGIVTPDLLLVGEVQGDDPTPPSSGDTGHYLDRPPSYDTYRYGLQAQDLFGRRSEIAWSNEIKVPVLAVPPPISDLFAFYLDTQDPGKELDPQATKILSATGQSNFSGTALLISFRYPKASINSNSVAVQFFNVSYRHGRPNELLGTLSTPVIVGPPPAQATAPVKADVELTTVTPVPTTINGFGGERSRGTLQSHGEFFAVESATRLGTNLVRLRVRARRDYLPQVGEATLSMGRGGSGIPPHPAFVSPRDPATWSGFDLRHPKGATDQRPLGVSGMNNSVSQPLPVGLTAAQLVVSRTIEPPANLPPGQFEPASDWVYRIVVKNIQLPLPADLTEYPGAVTVQVVSFDGGRSELPEPAHVLRRAYGAPPPLTALATSEFVTATRPDFEGRIGVLLSWPKVPGVQKFNVYRVEVPKLLDARGANLQLAQDLLENESNRAQVKLLGGQLASISSFTLITPVPIAPETDPDAPTRHRWTDRIAAPRDQSYVYRIQPLSAAGTEAPWPPDSAVNNENRNRCILVLQKNRDLLLAPAIYELEPLDRSVGVVVRNPLSPTVNGLRIYKTDQPSQVADVRSMTLIHGTIPFTHTRIQSLPADNGTPARLKFIDQKVEVGVQYFYRVIFVDEFGNFSQASEPMAATPRSFAPPEPPTLSATRTGPGTVNLSWQADHNEGQVKPQRRRSGEGQWIDVTATVLAPTDTVVDNGAVGIVAHRLLLRDAKGRVVFSDVVITEA